jgi:osmotically-inducible protein OsmY
MPKIYNALQLKAGAKSEYNRMGTITQPVQFLLTKDKDVTWGAWNMDWHEMQGLKQIRRNARRLMKNYKLANGIIDKSDYIVEENNEMTELIDTLTKEDESAFELKFFPIIPNVINVLTGEFAKRNDKITYRAVDDTSFNELVEMKRSMIEETLVSFGEQKMQQTIQQMGMDLQDPEQAQQAQQMMSPENIKSLPEIEQFFKKDYRSMIEQWASHQHEVDGERFKMTELENLAFKDMLIADREFWHFNMREDDYEIELWNPLLTFYHKSPEARYISQSNWAGRMDLMTISDIIDKYGYMMNEEQLAALEVIYPVKSAGYMLPGVQNDGSFYDATRSHEWNVEGPSLGMRQFIAHRDAILNTGDDIIYRILNESEDLMDFSNYSLLRVTTVYWKSQRMVGHLTKIDEEGIPMEMIVDENYKVTDKPIYDNTVLKNKSKDNLLFGEHIDWIWINQTWGGIKIGPNRPSFYGNNDSTGFAPIYLNVRPVRFQFKGDFTLYGCKLPVEGAVFSDRNTKSRSLIDKMKPYQVGYNLVNNQIADILVDELGTVIMLDQNALPRHSMGEDWGKNNLANAYVAMKNFQMLPLDTSITNTENALNFQHYQVLNLEQTQRLLSRIQLSTYFKNQAFEAIGITPQRLGGPTSQETATGVTQALNQSFSQTEMYFVQHSENLMPRVHQMRTDLAQYYHSNKPSVRLQYMTSMDEKVNFEINGTELLARELNVFTSTKVNQRMITEQIRQLALSNNTAGASIYDLGNIIKADSMADITHTLKTIEEKVNAQRQQEQQAAQQGIEMQQQAETERQDKKLAFEAEQNQLDRDNSLREAEIRSAGYTGMQDMNENKQSDYIDTLKYLDDKNAKSENIALQRDKELNQQVNEQRKANLTQQELQVRERIADKQVQIAAMNKNKYDSKSTPKKK